MSPAPRRRPSNEDRSRLPAVLKSLQKPAGASFVARFGLRPPIFDGQGNHCVMTVRRGPSGPPGGRNAAADEGRRTMAGLKDKRGFIDKDRLDLSERQAVEYWMKRWGVTREQITAAHRRAGRMVRDIAADLGKKR
jgi:hypothetical protein